MPVQIGAKTHSFSDPTGLLSDCHRRVEMFMAVLQTVADLSHSPLSDDTHNSLAAALRYFRDAAPKHTANEEESLFPVLRISEDHEMQQALAKLTALEADHRWAEPLHQLVDELGQQLLQTGTLSSEQAARFKDAVSQLGQMYRHHIAMEDQEVFPVAARVLTAEQKKRIADEMAARRQ